MEKTLLIYLLCGFLCVGCVNTKIDPKVDTNVDTNVDIQTQVESFLNANLDSLIKAQVDTKVQGVGVEVKNKLADQLTADIKHDLKTEIQAMFANTTQNTGMFSGGAIYLVIVAIVFLLLLFGTIIWITKYALQWKKIWYLLSQCIEEESKEHKNSIQDLKKHFSTQLQEKGLKNIVDKNLEKRGMRKKSRRREIVS